MLQLEKMCQCRRAEEKWKKWGRGEGTQKTKSNKQGEGTQKSNKQEKLCKKQSNQPNQLSWWHRHKGPPTSLKNNHTIIIKILHVLMQTNLTATKGKKEDRRVNVLVCVDACACVRVHVCVHTCMCMCVCLHACACMHLESPLQTRSYTL